MAKLRSPFKFLDSYEQQDRHVFFGRERETAALYDALSGVKHLLVYGPSGAGKTSLIECGLRNQFSPADWFAISIRRGEYMMASIYAGINEALLDKIELDPENGMPIEEDLDLGKAIEKLFGERFQPIYLLFDQFEELLLAGEESEKKDFFISLEKLIRYKVPCRVLLIMREEFIGFLSEFEAFCPTLFKYRFRLEKMTRSHVQEVIQAILEAPYYTEFFQTEDASVLSARILSKLPDDRKEIDLSHVQVFLSELWDRSLARNGSASLPLLGLDLVQDADNLERVLDSFLKKQIEELSTVYGAELPLELLAAMISERYTKLQLGEESIQAILHQRHFSYEKELLPPLLGEFERRRILRKLKSGEQTRYEISHDTLALVVGQNRTEEMRLRDKADDIYKVYAEKRGYFSQSDLDLLRPYQQYLVYPEELAARILDSEKQLKAAEEEKVRVAVKRAEEERILKEKAEASALRSRKITRIAAGVALIALIAATAAGIFFNDAQSRKEEAEANLLIANQALLETEKEKLNTAIRAWQNDTTAAANFLRKFGDIPEIRAFQLEAETAKTVKDSFQYRVDSLQHIVDSMQQELTL